MLILHGILTCARNRAACRAPLNGNGACGPLSTQGTTLMACSESTVVAVMPWRKQKPKVSVPAYNMAVQPGPMVQPLTCHVKAGEPATSRKQSNWQTVIESMSLPVTTVTTAEPRPCRQQCWRLDLRTGP